MRSNYLEGLCVCGGVAIGRVSFMGYEFDARPKSIRISASEVPGETERFRTAVEACKDQLQRLRANLEKEIGSEEARILGVHLAYLDDPTFRADVEGWIHKERLPLESALMKVVHGFDRIFELVENDKLRESAFDLRDVSLRVLRTLEKEGRMDPPALGDESYILVTKKLTITDMFRLENQKVLGILAEEGGPSSHAGILARSMGIPTVTGIPDLREQMEEGDYVILDATAGLIYVNPEDRLRREYEGKALQRTPQPPFQEEGPPELGDGTAIDLLGSCGNLGEVVQSVDAGLDGIGLYRTELLFLLDKTPPGEEMLHRHYAEILAKAEGQRVVFRLLDLSEDLRPLSQEDRVEANPALGLKGIRYLLKNPALFRTQLRALLRLEPGGVLEIVVPFVTAVQDLQRVREMVRCVRGSLRKDGIPCVDEVRVGAVVEIPSTAFALGAVGEEADFLVIALDDLQQYLLAADRDSLEVADYYKIYHPAFFKLLAGLAKEARRLRKKCLLFGEAVTDPLRLPFFVGVGFRSFSVTPVRSPKARKSLRAWTVPAAETLAKQVLRAPDSLSVQKVLLEAER